MALSQQEREKLRKTGHAMPASKKNKSKAPRYPIKTRYGKSNSLQAAIRAVGRARPNTPAEHAKVRAYIKRVAAKHGWSADIPDSWK